MALRTASTQAAGASRPRSRRVSAAAASAKPSATSLSSRSRTSRNGRRFGHDAAGKGDRGRGQIALGDLVDDAVRKRFRRPDRLAGDDHLQRLLRSDQARQALRAAGAGQEAELDLGQADARRRGSDPEMAGERQLEAAAERGAVQGRDDRLRHRLDRGDDLARGSGPAAACRIR